MLPFEVLALLSSADPELIDEAEEALTYSIGAVPMIVCALFNNTLLVERRATGDEIWARDTDLQMRWLAARPKNEGVVICISGLFLRLVVKARASILADMLMEL